MNRKFAILGWVILAVFVAGLSYTGVRIHSASPEMCQICQRPIHAETRTVAEANGERMTFCCPMCIRMIRNADVKVVSLTDHNTGEAIDPSTAWVVTGSSVNHCHRALAQMDDQKQTVPMDFDRCSPSIIAFATQAAAERFQSEYGGELGRFNE